MKLKSICAICCVAGMASVSAAQDIEFTKYVGSIPTAPLPIPLAASAEGKLFYATFGSANSQIWVVEDPITAVNSETTPGKHLKTVVFPTTRGFQGLKVNAAGSLFAIGDNGSTSLPFRFDPVVVGSETTYTEVTSFGTNVQGNTARKLGLEIVSNAGAGLLAINSLTEIHYFNFAGTPLGGSVTLPRGNNREPQFNTINNTIYPLRNGIGTSVSLEAIVTGVNTSTGGGTVITGVTLPGADGAASGIASSHGFYYPAQHQLITVGQTHTLTGGTTVPGEVRVWDILENGTSFSLAYSIKGSDSNVGWQDVKDAVVIGNRLYVSSHAPSSRIYVYEGVPASVNGWDQYEASDAVDRRGVSGSLK